MKSKLQRYAIKATATIGSFALLMGWPGFAATALASAFTINTSVIHVPFFIQDVSGNPPSGPNTPLYEARAHNPILAPDGHQVTLREFNRVRGVAMASCNNQGTHVVLHMTGLIPNGIYTVWNVTFKTPGFVPNPDPNVALANVIGIGALGPGDGSRSHFRASTAGTASLSATTPIGPLSMVGSISKCSLTGEFEWHVVGAYHLDGQTHGGDLGPDGTAVEQFGWIMKTP